MSEENLNEDKAGMAALEEACAGERASNDVDPVLKI